MCLEQRQGRREWENEAGAVRNLDFIPGVARCHWHGGVGDVT